MSGHPLSSPEVVPATRKSPSLTVSEKGRTLKKPEIKLNIMNGPKFSLRTVPDIQLNTRIIAVCGVVDYRTLAEVPDKGKVWEKGTEQPKKFIETGNANPVVDGWFLSDFYAFKHLFEGIGSSQKWITAENPTKLVQQYGEYLHGSPFYERKVVLNQDILNKGFMKNFVSANPTGTGLKDTFKQQLKEEADYARKFKQPLLVLIFGHGDYETKGISLGTEEPTNWFHMNDFQEAVGDDLAITFISTACFSGGWTITMNHTALVGAGPEKESESWLGSDSMGRFCGSMFATALFEALQKESYRAESLPPTAGSEEQLDQQHTYAEFTEIVYDQLIELDRFVGVHDIRFSAQDEDWMSAWGDRTGVPLSKFKDVWDSLPIRSPTQDPTASSNRDSSNQLGTLLSRQATIRGRFASASAFTNHVVMCSNVYLASLPGRDSMASNTPLHGPLKAFLRNPASFTLDSHLWVLHRVQYRTELMVMATRLLDQAGIARPGGIACADFDVDAFINDCDNHPESLRSRKNGYCAGKILRNILPDPDHNTQGTKWRKPHNYIVAAIASDTLINEPAHIDDAIRRLEQAYARFLKDLEEKAINQDEKARIQKRKWYRSLEKRLRSLSPDKRKKRRSTGATPMGSPLSGTPFLPRHDSPKGKGKGPAKDCRHF